LILTTNLSLINDLEFSAATPSADITNLEGAVAMTCSSEFCVSDIYATLSKLTAIEVRSCRTNASPARGEARPDGVPAVLRVTGVLSMHRQAIFGMAFVAMMLMAQAPVALAQDNRLQKIEDRLSALERRIAARDGSDSSDVSKVIAVAAVTLGIALFCGRWAQQNGRDFWLWFSGALIFNIFALIYLGLAIGDDKAAKRRAEKQAAKEAQEL
jgi:hypothetical protein